MSGITILPQPAISVEYLSGQFIPIFRVKEKQRKIRNHTNDRETKTIASISSVSDPVHKTRSRY
jgi:hypothetical protein